MANHQSSSVASDKSLVKGENDSEEYHDNDVLCGRGGSINSHPGNERFRELVEKRKRVYLTARFKREKRLIANSIVSEIRALKPPGRFLSRDSATGQWVDIGDEKARDKTSQALRENAPTIRAEIETQIHHQRAEMQREEEAVMAGPPPPPPHYYPWGNSYYSPFYGGFGPPQEVPHPGYHPHYGGGQPWPANEHHHGHYAYAQAPEPSQQRHPHGRPETSPADHLVSPAHSHTSQAHSHVSPAHSHTSQAHSRSTPPEPSPPRHQAPAAAPAPVAPEPQKWAFENIPNLVTSVPSSIAAWTRSSFSLATSTERPEGGSGSQPTKPLPYLHHGADQKHRVHFQEDLRRASYYDGQQQYSYQQDPNYADPAQQRVSQSSSKRPKMGNNNSNNDLQPYSPESPDNHSNSLLAQVASHILGSWDTPNACANDSSVDHNTRALGMGDNRTDYSDGVDLNRDDEEECGQEVELVEIMDYEDAIIEEDDDIREENARNAMPPPQERRIEIDWPSRVGSCHTWLPETPSFFSSSRNPLSPAASMEMDQSAAGAFSCGSIGGASLCYVFGHEAIGQTAIEGQSNNPSPTHAMNHKVLNQIPSWERSFMSKSPSTICSDSSILSKGSSSGEKLGGQVSPMNVPVNVRPLSPRPLSPRMPGMDGWDHKMRE